MPEPGWDLLDVVGDEGDRRERGVGRERRDPPDERLAGAEVEAGRRLVEQDELRLGHQGPGDEDPLALAGRERGERPALQPGQPEPLEGALGAPRIVGRVGVPPRRERGVAGAQHHVERGEAAVDLCCRAPR